MVYPQRARIQTYSFHVCRSDELLSLLVVALAVVHQIVIPGVGPTSPNEAGIIWCKPVFSEDDPLSTTGAAILE